MTTLHSVTGMLQFGATASSIALARRRHAYKPVAWFLAVTTTADLVRQGLTFTGAFAVPGPYHGWARLIFHLDETLFLLWMFGIIALTWRVLRVGSVIPSAIGWLVACLVVVAWYPTLRQDALQAFYLAVELVTLFCAAAAVVSWWVHRDWTERAGVEVAACFIIMALEVGRTFGPYMENNVFQHWDHVQSMSFGLYGSLLLLHGWSLRWYTRNRS